MMRLCRSVLLAALCAGSITSIRAGEKSLETLESIDKQIEQARHDYDDARLRDLQEKLRSLNGELTEGYRWQRLVAETYLYRANMRRTERTIRELDSETVSKYRTTQAEWGKTGMQYAERALELANTASERAHAHRIIGELYVHQINGAIAGIINGPRALGHVSQALEEAPEDPECNRAIGLMYLYNPPINGGDVDKAIKTFRKCSEKVPKSDEYQLYLAMAFRKKEKRIRAEIAAKKALRLNPKNVDAKYLLEELKKEEGEK